MLNTGLVTIKDVAIEAGVSIATVSRVINNKKGVSSDLVDKIRKAISKLGYRPNTIARALKARSTRSLGLIIPTIENPVFPPLVKVIEETANRYGYCTFLCNSDNKVGEEVKYLSLLLEKQVDGIIFDAIGTYDERFESVRRSNTPIVIIGQEIDRFRSTTVTIDNFKGAYKSTEYLIQKGKKKIAYLYGYLESKTALEDRFNGYKKALSDYSLRYNEHRIAYGTGSQEGGVEATEEIINSDCQFDSIISSNDIMALGCIKKLLNSGINVPDDVSVIGFDDIPFASIFLPSLSTIHSPLDILGKEAVKSVLRIIHSKKDHLTKNVIEPHLVIRDSSI